MKHTVTLRFGAAHWDALIQTDRGPGFKFYTRLTPNPSAFLRQATTIWLGGL